MDIGIWNGYILNLIIDIKDKDYQDIAYAIDQYHPAVHIPPPLAPGHRIALCIFAYTSDSSGDDHSNSEDDYNDDDIVEVFFDFK